MSFFDRHVSHNCILLQKKIVIYLTGWCTASNFRKKDTLQTSYMLQSSPCEKINYSIIPYAYFAVCGNLTLWLLALSTSIVHNQPNNIPKQAVKPMCFISQVDPSKLIKGLFLSVQAPFLSFPFLMKSSSEWNKGW